METLEALDENLGTVPSSERLSIPYVGGLFLLAYGGGAVVGAAVAWGNANAPRIIWAEHRTQAPAFWSPATFIINGALFVLVGVELQFDRAWGFCQYLEQFYLPRRREQGFPQ
ncbi:hypothetical protein ACH47Z_43895 [Streptomyces sp. NPDC020192]|uniref:hypothetical protein n=1 Tax=Streptomyces sp. NPDC020192 TaxID=3365066 RepID=UPI003792249A